MLVPIKPPAGSDFPTSIGASVVQESADVSYASTVLSRNVLPFPPITKTPVPDTTAVVLPRGVGIAVFPARQFAEDLF
jgi:hypothetical protein